MLRQRSTTLALMVILGILCVLTSCSKNQSSTSAEPDVSDPIIVGTKFFEAIRDSKTDVALSLVYPEDRKGFQKALEKGFPPIPDDFKLEHQSCPVPEGNRPAENDRF